MARRPPTRIGAPAAEARSIAVSRAAMTDGQTAPPISLLWSTGVSQCRAMIGRPRPIAWARACLCCWSLASWVRSSPACASSPGRKVSASYPARRMASTSWPRRAGGSVSSTVATSVERLTRAPRTPCTDRRAFSTRATQLPQVIPSTRRRSDCEAGDVF
jgi:hypothetical protein